MVKRKRIPFADAQDARTRVETMTRDGDFSWIADLLVEHRTAILTRWVEAASAQDFHAGRPERAVADHIPALVDALIAVLQRTALPADDAGATVHEPAVLQSAQDHARTRVAQGLATSEILIEFRLLRQEIGWAMRSHVADAAPTSDVLGAEILLHDALDDAAFLAALAVDQREAELRVLRETLAAEQSRLAAMLEQLPAAVMIAEAPSGQVALGHPAVKQLTRPAGVRVPAGENPNEWQGFYRDGRRYAPEEWPLARAIKTGEVVVGEEIDYLRDDGVRGTVSVNAAPVRDTAGAVMGAVAIFTDVTERKTLEEEKETYLAAITHDLRNPLTVISGNAHLLRRQANQGPVVQERLVEGLGAIADATSRMVGHLAELQDVASLRTGQALELDLAHVDMLNLARDAVGRQQHHEGNHKFLLHIPDIAEGGLVGEWDASRLARVLDNLLGNAVKFSPDGGTISVTLARARAVADEPATVVELRVVDDGMGIPADDLPHIFDWFRRASNAKGKIAGTGIGLAAARQIVELHGGSIHAESNEGRGSSFTVLLPLVDDSTAQSIG